jgi:hypothetical protein
VNEITKHDAPRRAADSQARAAHEAVAAVGSDTIRIRHEAYPSGLVIDLSDFDPSTMQEQSPGT